MSQLPTVHESFSYDRDTFFVEVGGHNRHRRATIHEIKDLLHPATPQSIKDPAGHWYEAQCLHYGLRPSKTKSVAKTRLLDALNSNALAVPDDIRKVEGKLKRQWNKVEKERLSSREIATSPPSAKNVSRKRKSTAVEQPPPEAAGSKKKKVSSKIKVGLDDGQNGSLAATPQSASGKANQTPRDRPVQTARRGRGSTVQAKNSNATSRLSNYSDHQELDTNSTANRGKQTAKCSRGGPGRAARASSARVPSRNPAEIADTPPRAKQTARRSRPFVSRGRGASSRVPAESQSSPPRTKQTARRSRLFAARGRGAPSTRPANYQPTYFPESWTENEDDASQCINQDVWESSGGPIHTGRAAFHSPYGREDSVDSQEHQYSSARSISETDNYDEPDDSDGFRFEEYDYDSGAEVPTQNDRPPPYEEEDPYPSIGPLGLLNGRYEISCPSLQHEWSAYDDYEFSLILTLQGEKLWGAYDFGMFSGILLLPQRPYEASNEKHALTWRGVENSEGVISWDEDRQRGWIKFLGNGRIKGNLRGLYSSNRLFSGTRVSGSNTRSERDARSMQVEWSSYNEDAYEEARVRRWH